MIDNHYLVRLSHLRSTDSASTEGKAKQYGGMCAG